MFNVGLLYEGALGIGSKYSEMLPTTDSNIFCTGIGSMSIVVGFCGCTESAG